MMIVTYMGIIIVLVFVVLIIKSIIKDKENIADIKRKNVKDIEERVQEEIDNGYKIVYRAKNIVKMEKKSFGVIAFILWIIFGFIIGGIVYLIYYALKSPDDKITISKVTGK